ncbi:uncharacterized protein TA04625 [Theileria annulata]|uniref:Tetratricopeptide SHNi-TPR domain-containing protein n=1 Tax=Theileria annulata TaxID=5874 RepID=Q4UBY9_THEAN|nr:uncharacterized protein TA04625 [Theileria annulata]CAI75662.1 hypothetical protein, conserved [Theileria annulata]|eukprot:XP_955138.1 hypothetical protein, conserved [Theileria annulata]
MSDPEVSEESDYQSLSVDELFQKGKSLFKDKKYLESSDFFSRALEKKSGDDPLNYSLRNYYLWYADSLLTNEEQSSNIFSSNVNEGSNSTLPSAETVLEAAKTDENNQNDEMLAFEMFQFAFECFMNYFKHLENNNKAPEQEDVLDASYCLLRLGDMFFTNHQFEESSKDYERAIKLREENGLSAKHLASLYISLAQSQMFNGKLKESLETFNKSRELLRELLEGEEGSKEVLKNTLEDVTIQMEDLEKLISESSNTNNEVSKGSQSNAASLIPKTTVYT